MKYRHEACSDIFKLKNIKIKYIQTQKYKNELEKMQLCSNQNGWYRGRYYILSTDIMTKWRFCLVVMMVVDDVRWSGVDGLPFWLLVLSSEAATSDMPILWVWAMRNQWLWAHLSPSMLQESRERSIKHQSSQNSLTHWVPDAALIGRMAEKGDEIVTMDGG